MFGLTYNYYILLCMIVIVIVIVIMYFSQKNKVDPRTCATFIPAWGSNWGSLGFPVIKITAVHQVFTSPASTAVWAWTWNTHKTPHGAQRSWTRWFCVFVSVVGKNPKTLNLSPVADNAITRGGIQDLGSPLYICGIITLFVMMQNKHKSKLLL